MERTTAAIYADALSPGDRIVGDSRYPSGMLDFLVQKVTKTQLVDAVLITVQILVERTVTYAGDDSVIVEIGPGQ